VRPAEEYLYSVIASPAGAYFPRGIAPVSVWLSTEYVRASPGGTGAAKFGGNYAASLLAQEQAAAKGCDQVVWLDAIDRKYVEEMGGMNLFFVFGSGDSAEIVTPELSGSLLPGVTRDSLLQLARHLGYPVTERRISVEEWESGVASGEISEVFACGTAAVITPVGSVAHTGGGARAGLDRRPQHIPVDAGEAAHGVPGEPGRRRVGRETRRRARGGSPPPVGAPPGSGQSGTGGHADHPDHRDGGPRLRPGHERAEPGLRGGGHAAAELGHREAAREDERRHGREPRSGLDQGAQGRDLGEKHQHQRGGPHRPDGAGAHDLARPLGAGIRAERVRGVGERIDMHPAGERHDHRHARRAR